MNVGQVHFDKGNRHRRQCVAQSDAGMGECSRIDQQEGDSIAWSGLDAVYELGLGVALEAVHLNTRLRTLIEEHSVDLGQRSVPVVFRFSGPQQIQVGTMKHQDLAQFLGHRSRSLPQITGNCPAQLSVPVEIWPMETRLRVALGRSRSQGKKAILEISKFNGFRR
jgi:hypothetical protein